ncbi:hypothetical protein GF312_22880 [Candidatus Poribacteria bacterium]|nr:hypothetical protein [Candidatus Poribacteria bacterium]
MMKNNTSEQFDALWEKSLKEPPLREVDVKKIEVDLSLSAVMDRFVLSAEKYLDRGEIEKEDYNDFVTQAENMKKVLTKINEKDLVSKEIEEKAKKISRDIQDRIDKLKADIGNFF